MKKNDLYKFSKRTFALVVLFFATLNVFIVNGNKIGIEHFGLSQVEVMANTEEGEEELNPFCHSGGKGSSQCSIDAGTEILGYGVSMGCSVTCNSGYYACCGLRCTCKKENNNQ